MKINEFINKMIKDGWVFDRWGDKDSFFLKKPEDRDLYIRVDIVQVKDQLDYLITFGTHAEVFPRVDRRGVFDFQENEIGVVTCTKEVRRDFMEKTR